MCVWVRMKNENYFIIQLIFATIYGPHYIFLTLLMNPIVLFQLTFIFIYSIFSNNFLILTNESKFKILATKFLVQMLSKKPG